MKSLITFFLAAVTFSIFAAFTSPLTDGLNVTYGVSEDNQSQIELRLNKDFTFTYQDLSNSSMKIVVEGTYRIKDKKVLLSANNNEVKFHDKWKITNDGDAAKSRKGLAFYTLRKK